jgi:hypothetical protein
MPASLAADVDTATPVGTASISVRFLRLLMLQHKTLLQHTSEIGETFINIRMQHMCIATVTSR